MTLDYQMPEADLERDGARSPVLTGKSLAEQGMRRDIGTRFKPGQSGNPNGRPKGARCKLAEEFFADALTVWNEGGIDALRRVRDTQPADYVRLMISILPREAGSSAGVEDIMDAISDDELAAMTEMLQRLVRFEQSLKTGNALDLQPVEGSEAFAKLAMDSNNGR